MMTRQHLPRTFFERFASAIGGVYPRFYRDEMPDDLMPIVNSLKKIPEERYHLRRTNSTKEFEKYSDLFYMLKDILTKMMGDTESVISVIEGRKSDDIGILIRNNGFDQSKVDYLSYFKPNIYPNDNDNSEEQENSFGFMLESLLEFSWDIKNNSNKIFMVEEQLMYELFNTSITNMSDEFLRLPFQTMCLAIPTNQYVTLRDEVVKYVYISELEDGDKMFFRFCYIGENEKITIHEFSFDGGDIFKQVERQLKQGYGTEYAYEDSIEIVQFIVAAILYINSKDVDRSDVYPNGRTKMNERTESKYPVCALGRGLKVDRNMHFINRGNGGGRGSFDIQVLKWMVRGHFRQQPIGEGRSDRKTIWIKPFLKGRERENGEVPSKPNYHDVK